MAEKMSWTELRKQLAKRAGVSEKEAGAFWNAFNSQLVEALKRDKQVKINGLGTFKLQAVAPRKSVNVKTGEAMTIEGYNKIVFAPEASVKELVDKKASPKPSPEGKGVHAAESEVDPLRKLGEQATEIVDILGELGQAPDKGEKKAKKKPTPTSLFEQPQAVLHPKEEGVPVAEEPKTIVEPEPAPVVEEPKEVEKPEKPTPTSLFGQPQAVLHPEGKEIIPEVEKSEEKPVVVVEKPKKKYHFLRDTLICVVVLLLILLIGYFFLRSQLSSWIESLVQPQKAQTEIVVADTTAVASEPTLTLPEGKEEAAPAKKETVKAEPVKQEPAKAEQPKTEQPTVAFEKHAQGYEILTVEEMHQDSRMTWMAKRYYGDKKYWPYIYDANKDRIPNPGRIQVGQPVRIPKLTKAQMDTTRAETREKLERLTLEAEAACWAY